MTVTVPAGLPDPPSGFGELWWIPALAGHGGGGAQGVEMLLSTLLPWASVHWVRGAAPSCTLALCPHIHSRPHGSCLCKSEKEGTEGREEPQRRQEQKLP